MWNLKHAYIDKMISGRLTSREVDFLLEIAGSLDDGGNVYGVYYKDICRKIGISCQKFYDILNSLQDKGLIIFEKGSYYDFNVHLAGNDFRDGEQARSEGYLKLGDKDFSSAKFRKLKAGGKLILLYLLRFRNGKDMPGGEFCGKFAAWLGVKVRTVKEYLREIMGSGLYRLERAHDPSDGRLYRFRPTEGLKRDKVSQGTENQALLRWVGGMIARRCRLKLPEYCGMESPTLQKVVGLISQHKLQNRVLLLERAVNDSFRLQEEEGRKERTLNAALVHKMLLELI